jgi:hypothetical protein
MNMSREMRRFAQAFASTFTLFPRTDYRAAYPRRSAEELMERAWARTASDFNHAFEGVVRRDGNR